MSIENVPATSIDLNAELQDRLRDLIPGAFPDGNLDPGALLSALGFSGDSKPSFSFTWPGIEQARTEARIGTTATLIPDLDDSVDWDVARDVLIEGDNLQVLKLLLRGYSRQAKLIYIDPPYNTGEKFVYNDNYSIPESEYLTKTGQVDELGQATTSKIENAGRKHAPWLSMMFPRLAVARQLLRRDGVILVSIDDNEVHHLRLLLDAVFGATNFLGTFVWEGGRKNDARRISLGHDYIVAYARDKAYMKDKDIRWRERKSGLEAIYAKADELRAEYGTDYDAASKALQQWYKDLPEGNPSKEHSHYKLIDKDGVWFPDNISSPNYRENLIYEWKGYKPPTKGWRYELDKMTKLDAEGLLIYPESKDSRIQFKRYLHRTEYWAPASVFYKDRRAASKALTALMDAEVFDYPKDVDSLAKLIRTIVHEGELVVDFFAGSGSTGHAVWQQCVEDAKARRWLLVQAPEATDEDSDARKAGYEKISAITVERLKRAAKQFADKSATESAWRPSFRVFRAGKSNLIIEPPIIASDTMTGAKYVQTSVAQLQESPIVSGADPLAVAWEVVLKATATQLDASVDCLVLNGVTVYEFVQSTASGTGRLFVSLDAFDLSTADGIGLTEDDTLIVRGDLVTDSTTLTLAPRCKLVLLERVPREVSL